MTRRSWSISRRLAVWFAITTAGLVIAVTATSAWFVQKSLQRELEALVLEELDELKAFFAGRPVAHDSVRTLTESFAAEHPGHPLAWRFWSAGGELWGEYGATELFDGLALDSQRIEEMVTPAAGLRWRVEGLALRGERDEPAWDGPVRVGLLVDGSRQMALVRRSGLQAFGLLLLGAIVATIGGALFGRRISAMLHQVAGRVRGVHDPADPVDLDFEDAPLEIRDVAEALGQMLGNIRDESARAQLLTAGLAHELRSPIQNLLGEAEVTLMRGRHASEYRAVLESQVEELRDLGRVVDNLVTLCAASERRRGSGDMEEFDIGQEARLRLRRERVAAEQAGVQLQIHSHGDLVLRGDREALLLAVRNLVGNGIHWSPAGGGVRLDLEGAEDAVTVTIADDGPGIPESERERVFEPFYRGPALNGRRVGYGLGLALTRQAVRSHGGTIELGASESGGALFRVRLPRCAV